MSEIKAGVVNLINFVSSESKKFQGYIDYMDRDEAVRVENIEKFDLFATYIDYMDNENKTDNTLMDMSKTFTSQKDAITVTEKNELKGSFKKASEAGSLMWQNIISFDNRYLKVNGLYIDDNLKIVDEKRLINAARLSTQKMLKAEGLENAIWAGNIHYDTDNIHIHIAIVEPIPTRTEKLYPQWKTLKGKYVMRKDPVTGKNSKIPLLDKNGNQIYKLQQKGRFSEKSIRIQKSTLVSEIENNKELIIEMNSLMRNVIAAKKNISLTKTDDILIKEKLNLLYEKISRRQIPGKFYINNWSYSRNLLADLREDIDEISDYFINNYFKKDFDKLNEMLDKKEESQKLAYGEKSAGGYKENKLADFYKRMGNAVLKELAHLYKEELERENKARVISHPHSKEKSTYSDDIFLAKRDFKNAFFKIKKTMQDEKDKFLNEIDHEKLMQEIEEIGI